MHAPDTSHFLAAVSRVMPPTTAQVDEIVGSQLLQGLVAKVADSKVVVRKAASQVLILAPASAVRPKPRSPPPPRQALVSYMQSTRDAEAAMICLVRTGLEAADWRQRQVRALPCSF